MWKTLPSGIIHNALIRPEIYTLIFSKIREDRMQLRVVCKLWKEIFEGMVNFGVVNATPSLVEYQYLYIVS